MSDISYEIDNDGVAVVTWDLKDRTMNVLNFNSLGEYGEAIKKLITYDPMRNHRLPLNIMMRANLFELTP